MMKHDQCNFIRPKKRLQKQFDGLNLQHSSWHWPGFAWKSWVVVRLMKQKIQKELELVNGSCAGIQC